MQVKTLMLALFVAAASAGTIGTRQNNNNNNGCNVAVGNGGNQGGADAGNGIQNGGNADNNNDNGADNGGAVGGGAADGGAADFGQCTPTMDFVAGRPGRKADESTFLPTDPLVAEGQQDALNPNIITRRICDQLTNVCEANDAAKALCEDAQATVEALGTRDETTAAAFNAALGF